MFGSILAMRHGRFRHRSLTVKRNVPRFGDHNDRCCGRGGGDPETAVCIIVLPVER